jgi:hypothetical protein
VVSGASGSGKTAVCQALWGRVNQAILLDSDILWRGEFDSPETKYRDFFETWLRMCKNISQAGRPVALFGAGMGVPDNLEPCVERRYLSRIHYLALVCEDEILAQRLMERPTWRGCGEKPYIDAQQRFNQWFKDYDQQPSIELIDTSHATVEETAHKVKRWIEAKTITDQP